jgi:hypothetical protein
MHIIILSQQVGGGLVGKEFIFIFRVQRSIHTNDMGHGQC